VQLSVYVGNSSAIKAAEILIGRPKTESDTGLLERLSCFWPAVWVSGYVGNNGGIGGPGATGSAGASPTGSQGSGGNTGARGAAGGD
jgi:hypothetical protein